MGAVTPYCTSLLQQRQREHAAQSRVRRGCSAELHSRAELLSAADVVLPCGLLELILPAPPSPPSTSRPRSGDAAVALDAADRCRRGFVRAEGRRSGEGEAAGGCMSAGPTSHQHSSRHSAQHHAEIRDITADDEQAESAARFTQRDRQDDRQEAQRHEQESDARCCTDSSRLDKRRQRDSRRRTTATEAALGCRCDEPPCGSESGGGEGRRRGRRRGGGEEGRREEAEAETKPPD